MHFLIDPMKADDWESVRSIYLEGIATGNATFETDAPDWDAWNSSHLEFGRILARTDETIVGWAALSGVSGRCVYAGVAETSVYIAAEARGQGVGKALLDNLIVESERNGIWTLQAGIFPENIASRAIHRLCGFREVGLRERIGKHHGKWRDVILFERRSSRVGMDSL
jgi:L-amino acid N-acyltransferase YncA